MPRTDPQSMEEIEEELEKMQRVGLIPHQDFLDDEREETEDESEDDSE